MAFNNSTDDDVLSEINVTPLVDVMLVLLVAFIVTAPLLNNAIHVNLPKTVTTSPPDQLKPVTISVDKEGRVYIDKKELSLAQVELELKRRQTQNPEQTYHLNSDDSVQYGKVAKVMALIEKSGITKLSVLTQSG
ncbi:MAG: biopolymer transporter ExbD [Methylotenera sp.]|nr:biopolymer transporter ExbD [Methylotenera sp.]